MGTICNKLLRAELDTFAMDTIPDVRALMDASSRMEPSGEHSEFIATRFNVREFHGAPLVIFTMLCVQRIGDTTNHFAVADFQAS